MSETRLFEGKNCLVLGAATDVGTLLCQRLVARGGFVVAVDDDEEALVTLARPAPDQIAPLATDPSDATALGRLTASWGPDPLHVLIFAHPMTRGQSLAGVLESVTAATRDLAPLMEASNGAALVVFEAAEEEAAPLDRAVGAAMAQLTEELARDGARINALALYGPARAPKASAQLCATAMMMLLPMSAAISGAVLPVGRHGMPVQPGTAT